MAVTDLVLCREMIRQTREWPINTPVAVFMPATSPLTSGRNVLLVSVDGIVPGTTRTATDANRFTFTRP